MTEFEVFTDPRRFRDEIAELIARDPVGATMLSGVLANRIAAPAAGAGPLLVVVRDVDGVAVGALRSPGFPLLVTADPEVRDRPGVLRMLVDGVLDLRETVVGLHGRRELVRQLADAWADATGVRPEPHLWLRYHRLARLVEPADVRGAARPLDPDDAAEVGLVAQWLARFQEETGTARGPVEPDPDGLRRMLGRGDRFTFWGLDPEPGSAARAVVSVAGHSPLRADGGCRIAPVYTPPQWRRNRFGAAVTAAAVRSAHALGATEVTLFTDEEYRPANDLYASLGFEPIAEFVEFDLPAATPPGPADPAAER